MARLSIYLLGSFRITLEGQPVTDFISDKARALLIYLAVEADSPHRRERLAGLLWPDYPEQDARRSLSTALASVRGAIGDRAADPPFLHISRQTIQFNRASDSWIDVVAFTTRLRTSGGAREGDPQTIPHLQEALKWYQGELLEGFSIPDSPAFEEWALIEREGLSRLADEALNRLIAWHEDRSHFEDALLYARRRVDLDPLRESAHRQLMRLRALNGQRAEALKQYEACCKILEAELGVEPDEKTRWLYDRIQAGELQPPVSPLQRVVNASARRDVRYTFRDRTAETAWLRACLAEPDAWLISVVGRGGYGKSALVTYTTLEAETGSLSLDGHDLQVRGVAYFHPSRTGLTLGRLYTDLGVMLGEPHASILADRWQDPAASIEQKAYFLLEQMRRATHDHEMILIVLDALEGGLDEAGRLTDEGLGLWLEACLASGGPVRLIVTSRQEWLLPEGSTAVVRQWNLERGLPVEDGVAVLRVLDPEGRCRLRDADEALLHRAVQQTEGVPFSLEKIAGLLRASPRLSLDQLLDDEEIFEREVSLALAERGFSHLSPDQRRVMQALAIYGQPVPAPAMAFVLSDEENLATVEALLEELARGYFVTYHRDDETWALHDIDAQVVCARLDPETQAALHRRVGEFYRLGGEPPDLLKVAHHFQQAGDHPQAAELATADAEALIKQGQVSELREVLTGFAAEDLDSEQWATVQIALGDVHTFLGESDLARASYEDALSQLRTLPDSPELRSRKARVCRGMGTLLEFESAPEAEEWLRRGLDELGDAGTVEEALLRLRMGSVLIGMGDFPAAESALQRSLQLLPEGPSDWRASVLGNLGVIHCAQGDVAGGRVYFQDALEIYQAFGNRWGMVGARHNLGMAMEISGDWSGAVAEYRRAADLAEQLGDVRRQQHLELCLGILHTNQGDVDGAAAHLERCIELARAHNMKEPLVHGLSSLADLRIRLGEWQAAEALVAEAEQLVLEIETNYHLPEIYRRWAELCLVKGELPAALEYAERSVNLAQEMEMESEVAVSRRVLGQVLASLGELGQAYAVFEESLAFLAEYDPYEAARTRMEWGKALISAGSMEWGIVLLQEVRGTFEELGASRDASAAKALLAEQGQGSHP